VRKMTFLGQMIGSASILFIATLDNPVCAAGFIEGCYEPKIESSANVEVPPLHLTDELIGQSDVETRRARNPDQPQWHRVVAASPARPIKSTSNLWVYRGNTVSIVLTDTGYDSTVIRVRTSKNGMTGTMQTVHELSDPDRAFNIELMRRPCESFR